MCELHPVIAAADRRPPEIPDQALGDAGLFQGGQRGIFWRNLAAIKELKAADPKAAALAILEADKTLLKKYAGEVLSAAARCKVSAPKPKLALGRGSNGVVAISGSHPHFCLIKGS